jgi:hypothetical protein
VLHHAGNTTQRVGFVTDIHYDTFLSGDQAGKKKRNKPLPKPCPKCEAVMPPRVSICPACGHERKLPPVEREIEGDLQERSRDGKKTVATMAEKQRFWSMALWLDDSRGRGGKLAKGLYKGKFDVWPKGLFDNRVPADQAFLNYEKSRRIAFAKMKEAEKVKLGGIAA